MAKFEILFPYILKVEGGFVNDPADAGGATNMGITLKTYAAYCAEKGLKKPTIADLKKIDNEVVAEIYRTRYWDKWKAADIKSQKVANIVVDWYINSGVVGIKKAQTAIGTLADGVVGKMTIAAINAANPDDLFVKLCNARVEHYNNIVRRNPSQRKFLKGWLNRLDIIKNIPV